jgi:serine protease
MNLKRYGSILPLVLVALGSITPSTAAASTPSDQFVSGFIVEYEPGVAPIAQNGEPTGANLLRGTVWSEDLGGGYYFLELAQPIEAAVANNWINRMVLDRRIANAVTNFEIRKSSANPTTLKIPSFAKARPASAPRSLTAREAVTSTSPQRPRVRLSWKAPTSRYGAKIVGYSIQYSSNAGSSYTTLIRDTGSSQTRVFVSDGLRAGVTYRFRVRAITNDGSATDTFGTRSNTASVVVRTAPKPVFITSAERVGPGNVTFLAQSVSDRGGYPTSKVRYRAIATAADIQSVESSLCNETRCRFPDLLEDTSYSIEVFASNERGTSSSNDALAVSDELFPNQWYLSGENGVSMPSAWKYSRGDRERVVAVIDTGIKSHEQIDSSLTRNPDGTIYGYDFVSDITSAADGDAEDSNPNDEGENAVGTNYFHGTHVAGIIAAKHDYIGTAGIAPNVRILPVRALGRTKGEVKDLVQAIRWAAGEKIPSVPVNKYPVSVINLSLGSQESAPCSGILATVIEETIAKGITIVVAAGNEARGSLSFPANCNGVISVAATQSLGDRASYSNFGEGTFISAPGGEINIGSTESPASYGAILSTWVSDTNAPDYRLDQGTSMAAPVVSGIIALMYSLQPSISPSKVRAILKESVRPFSPGSSCAITGGCGFGIINAQLAMIKTSSLR